MKTRPSVVVFDVIETLFPLEPLKPLFESAGLSGSLLPLWFARLLRDGFALDSCGIFRGFREIAVASLKVLLDEHDIDPDIRKIEPVLQAFARLKPHPDARPALERLRSAGVRVLTLSNGNQEASEKMVAGSGLRDLVERVLTIDQVRRWKPAKEVYLHAVNTAEVSVEQVALVAAHAWDCQGAAAAGLTTGFVMREEKLFSPAMALPTVSGQDLGRVAEGLLALPEKNS